MAPSSNQAFKAISDPTRREILRLLRRGEMTAGDLAERFDMTKPTMSHHFSVLKDADLLTSRRDGQQIWYGLNTTVVQDLMAWAMDLMRSNGEGKPTESPKEKSDGKKPGGTKSGGTKSEGKTGGNL
jgi:ArsR family transcriptional regulator, arsenate/arsenite/antimonite-responsive transcriptional repressor